MRRLAQIVSLLLIAFANIATGQQLDQSTLKTRVVAQDGFEKQSAQVVGAWAMTWDTYGLSGAEHLVATGETYTGTNGTVYLVVERAFTTTGLGLLDFDEQYGDWVLLFDSSTSYYRLFIFTVHGTEAAGLSWLYQKDSSPSGPGLWMRGFKFVDPEHLAGVSTAKGVSAASQEVIDELHTEAAGASVYEAVTKPSRAAAAQGDFEEFLLQRNSRKQD